MLYGVDCSRGVPLIGCFPLVHPEGAGFPIGRAALRWVPGCGILLIVGFGPSHAVGASLQL
jgi:hypothetical protein